MLTSQRHQFDQKYQTEFNTELIAGCDEAGRGAMAGPLVVAAIILPAGYDHPQIRDSKKLSATKRTQLYAELVEVALTYSIQIIDERMVESLNPKKASINGMIQALQELKPQPQLALIDGESLGFAPCPTIKLIKGDDLSLAIGAASILAKVTRDQIMLELDQLYPTYNWKQNKGYCTLDHQQKLWEFGLTSHHRLTYSPVKKVLLKQNKKQN